MISRPACAQPPLSRLSGGAMLGPATAVRTVGDS
ncbi:hypothetical protein ACPL_2251 [Actinoplanes sp. SE50/110]|nr:hypothetical protein ACPL_2251 [Actinoplanes sp. SE50/110]SLL98949.1 hypothetical protein ACSP50_2176 [Actinoplanes sp. SE50/110]